MSNYTFKQFQQEYPDDASCLAKLMEINYGGTEIKCPACKQQASFHPMSKRRAYACQDCGHHIYPCAGTIFHKSPTPLTKWFFAMYLFTSTRHGVAPISQCARAGCNRARAARGRPDLRFRICKHRISRRSAR